MDNCKKWLLNKNINPITNRKIKETGKIYKMFEKLCNEKEDMIKDNENIFKSFNSQIQRVSSDIMDRINYYIIVRKYIDYIKTKYKNNCIHTYKIIDNEKLLSVGKNIILNEKLGTGAFGVVYKAYFRFDNMQSLNKGKMVKMVVKICEMNSRNKKEVEVSIKLTELILKMVCPHFPVSYGYLTCNKNDERNYKKISSAISSSPLESSFTSSSDNISRGFFTLKHKPNLYLIVNEYADRAFPFVFYDIIKNNNFITASSIINNMIIQCFISMIFFQKYTGLVHYDTHILNFLVHYIKNDGEYYHYNIYGKDYYLENMGYLIVINDFGLVRSMNEKPINYDFNKFILSLKKYLIKHFKKFMTKNIIKFLNTIALNTPDLYKYLFNFMNKCFPNNLITSKPSKIINKSPFVI
jgi:hypothetical protein